jgi:hypothetical protein
MTWSFEASLAAFLALAFAAQTLSTISRSRLTLQFWLGALCIAVFALGLLPRDLVERSRMREVGVIAFNVLVVHSGTMVDLEAIRRQWKAALLCGALVLALVAVVGFGLAPIIGPALAAVSPGPVLGGGAAAAIASNALAGSRPELAAYPWLLFMMQCLFGLPLFSWTLRKAVRRADASGGARAATPQDPAPGAHGQGDAPETPAASSAPGAVPGGPSTPSTRPAAPSKGHRASLPGRYRTTAYYLGSLMLVSLFNKWLYSAFLSWTGVGAVVTALVLGIALRSAGILERDPLGKSDSFGLLMLGLMALMANALAKTSPDAILGLLPAVLLVFALGSLIVAVVGAFAGRLLGLGAWGGAAIAAGCMVGLPLCAALVEEAAAGGGDSPEGSLAAARLLPPVVAAASLMGNIVSIALASVSMAFL